MYISCNFERLLMHFVTMVKEIPDSVDLKVYIQGQIVYVLYASQVFCCTIILLISSEHVIQECHFHRIRVNQVVFKPKGRNTMFRIKLFQHCNLKLGNCFYFYFMKISVYFKLISQTFPQEWKALVLLLNHLKSNFYLNQAFSILQTIFSSMMIF